MHGVKQLMELNNIIINGIFIYIYIFYFFVNENGKKKMYVIITIECTNVYVCIYNVYREIYEQKKRVAVLW